MISRNLFSASADELSSYESSTPCEQPATLDYCLLHERLQNLMVNDMTSTAESMVISSYSSEQRFGGETEFYGEIEDNVVVNLNAFDVLNKKKKSRTSESNNSEAMEKLVSLDTSICDYDLNELLEIRRDLAKLYGFSNDITNKNYVELASNSAETNEGNELESEHMDKDKSYLDFEIENQNAVSTGDGDFPGITATLDYSSPIVDEDSHFFGEIGDTSETEVRCCIFKERNEDGEVELVHMHNDVSSLNIEFDDQRAVSICSSNMRLDLKGVSASPDFSSSRCNEDSLYYGEIGDNSETEINCGVFKDLKDKIMEESLIKKNTVSGFYEPFEKKEFRNISLESLIPLNESNENINGMVNSENLIPVDTPSAEVTVHPSPQTVEMKNRLSSNGTQVLLDIHLRYRVYAGGHFILPVDDIVINQDIMSVILHGKILCYLENETDIQSASRLQSFMWPVIARGQNTIALGEKSCGKSLGFVLPLSTILLDMWPCIEHEVSGRIGAIAIIVCKGWLAAQSVANTLSDLLQSTKIRVLAGWGGLGEVGSEDLLKRICTGSDILVTTMPFLMRLVGLSNEKEVLQFNLLSHCFHLIIDDADIVIDSHASGVKSLLTKWADSRDKTLYQHFSQQLVITASSWTEPMNSLSSFLTPLIEPAIIISAPLEAAKASRIRSHLHCMKDCSRNEILEKVTGLVKDSYSDKRIIAFVENTSDGKKLVSMFKCMAIDSDMVNGRLLVWQIQDKVRDWNASQSAKILIATVRAIPHLLNENLTDAEVIIHIDIPRVKTEFAERFSFTMKHFNVCSETSKQVHSHIFYHHDETLPRYLKKCLLQLNTEFLDVDIPNYNDFYDYNLPMCHILKAFGKCSDVHMCTWRHIALLEDRQKSLPENGIVSIYVVKVMNASRYFVRLMEYRESIDTKPIDLSTNYFKLFMKLQRYCSDCELKASEYLDVGSLCLVEHNSVWSRARVIVVHYEDHYTLFLIDEGDEITVCRNVLYELPSEFSVLPQLIIEVYLSNVCPTDGDTHWTSNANRFIEEVFSDLSAGSKMSGRIVLSLSNTLWVSPLVELVKVEKTFIRGESLRSRLIRYQYGADNPSHIDTLRKIFSIASEGEDSKLWLDYWSNYADDQ